MRIKAGSWLGGLLCVLLACGAARGAPAGPGLGYATYLGGEGYDSVSDVAVDTTGDIWVIGNTNSKNFPLGTNVSPQKDILYGFLAKISSSGQLIFSTAFPVGNDGRDSAIRDGNGVHSITLTPSGEVWIAGSTDLETFPIVGNSFQRKLTGSNDAFLAKFSASGKILYSTFLGGEGWWSCAYGIASDHSGGVWVTGQTQSENFPVTEDAYQKKYAGPSIYPPGGDDAFLARFSASGQLLYSTFLGGKKSDGGRNVVADSAGNVWVTGSTNSQNFPVTSNAFQSKFGGEEDVFVAKFSATNQCVFATYLGSAKRDLVTDIAVDVDENAWITGYWDSEYVAPMLKNLGRVNTKVRSRQQKQKAGSPRK